MIIIFLEIQKSWPFVCPVFQSYFGPVSIHLSMKPILFHSEVECGKSKIISPEIIIDYMSAIDADLIDLTDSSSYSSSYPDAL